MNSTIAIADEIVAQAVKAESGLEVSGITPILGRGMSNQVYVTATSRGHFVVRLNNRNHLDVFEKERWCLERAHEAGILVPKIVGCGLIRDYSYSISNYLTGSSDINSSHDRLRVWRILGAYARKLNEIPLASPFATEVAKHFSEKWDDLIAEDLSLAFCTDYWTRNGNLTAGQLKNLQKLLERCSHINAPHGVCQIDIGPDNALICNESYNEIFLIDLELAVLAPVPHYQLACVARTWGYSSEIMKELIAGYGISASQLHEIEPDLKNLIVLRAMRVAGRAHQKRANDFEKAAEKAQNAINQLVGKLIS